jgi:hypothetical protein
MCSGRYALVDTLLYYLKLSERPTAARICSSQLPVSEHCCYYSRTLHCPLPLNSNDLDPGSRIAMQAPMDQLWQDVRDAGRIARSTGEVE